MPDAGRPTCTAGSALPPGPWASWWLRSDPLPLLALAVLVMLGYLWAYRTPRVARVALAYYDDLCVGPFLFGLLAAGRGLQRVVREGYEARLGLPSRAHLSGRPFWSRLLAVAAVTFLLVKVEVPMHVGFLVSRPALDALADEALADPPNARLLAGRWAGLYRVAGAKVIGGTVVLYLGRKGGSFGFARVPSASGGLVHNRPGCEGDPSYCEEFPRDEGFADPKGERLAGDWFVMYSAYWKVKVGWS